MKTSQNGISLIQKFEGLRLKAYKCPAGKWTIGYGHTNNVRPDDIISKSEATELLIRDLIQFEGVINRWVTKTLNQAQFDACVSFVFNVGEGNFKKSTLLRKLNTGDYVGAANEFGKWVYSKGKKLNGLVSRRAAEKELFMKK